MTNEYIKQDVVNSYNWLGHRQWTELIAIHPEFKPGNVEENKKNNAFTKVAYASDAKEVLKFVEKYSQEHMVCYGLNQREEIFRKPNNYVRSAYEKEIEVSQNVLMDIDLQVKKASKAHHEALDKFVEKAKEYFSDKNLRKPSYAKTGRGMHLLFAHSPIYTEQVPDISLRNKAFTEEFRNEYKQKLEQIEAKIDSTHDLARKVKIYGTAKPWVGIVSRFYGKQREEDEQLRQYLLSINLGGIQSYQMSGLELAIADELPLWFRSLLEHDAEVRKLWHGRGKKDDTDTSGSGYDFSLARTLLRRGYRNLDELGTIVALRSRKRDEKYVRRTLGNALLK